MGREGGQAAGEPGRAAAVTGSGSHGSTACVRVAALQPKPVGQKGDERSRKRDVLTRHSAVVGRWRARTAASRQRRACLPKGGFSELQSGCGSMPCRCHASTPDAHAAGAAGSAATPVRRSAGGKHGGQRRGGGHPPPQHVVVPNGTRQSQQSVSGASRAWERQHTAVESPTPRSLCGLSWAATSRSVEATRSAGSAADPLIAPARLSAVSLAIGHCRGRHGSMQQWFEMRWSPSGRLRAGRGGWPMWQCTATSETLRQDGEFTMNSDGERR